MIPKVILVTTVVLSSGCVHNVQPRYMVGFSKPSLDCVEIDHEIGDVVRHYACPQNVSAVNVTAEVKCDEGLWKHVYHQKRLHVKAACISVTGTLMDASHGRNKDGCRHEADGDGHCWLALDKGQEGLLNEKNRSDQDGNLVIEPMCRYKVTQADAMKACRDWQQDLDLSTPGNHVRVTGAYVLDSQHGHMEIHPISSIEVIP